DVRAEAALLNRARRLEPEESTADHRAARHVLASRHDRVQILQRAVDEHAAERDAWQTRNEWRGTGGDDDVIVGDAIAARRLDVLALTIDARRLHAESKVDAVLEVPELVREPELVGGLRREVAGEPHAVVRGAWLFAEHGEPKAAARIELSETLAEAMAGHAVADDDDARFVRCDVLAHDAVPRRRWRGPPSASGLRAKNLPHKSDKCLSCLFSR